MIWNTKDIELFFQEQKYIDTAVVPLLPVSFGDQAKQEADQAEFIPLVTAMLEKQFKGRMMLLPPFTYFSSEDQAQRKARMEEWANTLEGNGFDHIFLVTSDPFWREVEAGLPADLIWLPSIPMEHMEGKYKQKIIEDQVSQLLKIVVGKWQAN
ncbi:YpiF family protein [Jeotgalibacillus sp. JSM ZJ347]|uniref:YpiF family protein n=1 Tax=Jeotgalibacillus sp. JSM ZJ347 TaxID=3342117 RepID=UPI0035A96383